MLQSWPKLTKKTLANFFNATFKHQYLKNCLSESLETLHAMS